MNWWRRAPARSRRNTVTRDDLPGIAAAALATAIVATLAGCHPTGNLVGDALVTGAGAGAVAWVASTASWWSLVAGGGIATACATPATFASKAIRKPAIRDCSSREGTGIGMSAKSPR